MSRLMTFIKGVGLGAGLMYLYDPDMGRRRRALLRDQAVRTLNEVGDAIDSTSRDLSNRAIGVASEIKGLLTSEPVSDVTLMARVRSQMGHVISNPHAVQVRAQNGVVTLSGSVPAAEIDALFRCVGAVRGVQAVENALETAPAEDGQMGSWAPGRYRRLPPTWSPTTRLMVGAVGSILAMYGRRRGGLLGAGVSAFGVGLLTRSVAGGEPGSLAPLACAPSPTESALADLAGSVTNAAMEHIPRAAHSV